MDYNNGSTKNISNKTSQSNINYNNQYDSKQKDNRQIKPPISPINNPNNYSNHNEIFQYQNNKNNQFNDNAKDKKLTQGLLKTNSIVNAAKNASKSLIRSSSTNQIVREKDQPKANPSLDFSQNLINMNYNKSFVECNGNNNINPYSQSNSISNANTNTNTVIYSTKTHDFSDNLSRISNNSCIPNDKGNSGNINSDTRYNNMVYNNFNKSVNENNNDNPSVQNNEKKSVRKVIDLNMLLTNRRNSNNKTDIENESEFSPIANNEHEINDFLKTEESVMRSINNNNNAKFNNLSKIEGYGLKTLSPYYGRVDQQKNNQNKIPVFDNFNLESQSGTPIQNEFQKNNFCNNGNNINQNTNYSIYGVNNNVNDNKFNMNHPTNYRSNTNTTNKSSNHNDSNLVPIKSHSFINNNSSVNNHLNVSKLDDQNNLLEYNGFLNDLDTNNNINNNYALNSFNNYNNNAQESSNNTYSRKSFVEVSEDMTSFNKMYNNNQLVNNINNNNEPYIRKPYNLPSNNENNKSSLSGEIDLNCVNAKIYNINKPKNNGNSLINKDILLSPIPSTRNNIIQPGLKNYGNITNQLNHFNLNLNNDTNNNYSNQANNQNSSSLVNNNNFIYASSKSIGKNLNSKNSTRDLSITNVSPNINGNIPRSNSNISSVTSINTTRKITYNKPDNNAPSSKSNNYKDNRDNLASNHQQTEINNNKYVNYPKVSSNMTRSPSTNHLQSKESGVTNYKTTTYLPPSNNNGNYNIQTYRENSNQKNFSFGSKSNCANNNAFNTSDAMYDNLASRFNINSTKNYNYNNNHHQLWNNQNYNNKAEIQKTSQKQDFVINLEDLLMIEEKLYEISAVIKNCQVCYHECFDWWNLYFNCSLCGNFEHYFKDEVNKQIIKDYAFMEMIAICLSYDACFDLEYYDSINYILKTLFDLLHQNFLIVCDYFLSKIAFESMENVWVRKLDELISSNLKIENLKGRHTREIKENNQCILDYIRLIMKNSPNESISDPLNAFLKNLQKLNIQTLNDFFRAKIIRIENKKASNLASCMVNQDQKNTESQKSENSNDTNKIIPAPYLTDKPKKEYCLVLDLDETMIHFKIDPKDETSGMLRIRPWVYKFLDAVSEYYEIMVFTAATSDVKNFVFYSFYFSNSIFYYLVNV